MKQITSNLITPDYRKRRTLNDDVFTNPVFAKKVIDYFTPQFKEGDKLLEPCAGDNAFYDKFPQGYAKDWCEISKGKDFLLYNQPADWVISNLPWSGRALRPIVRHASKLSNNVVHLIRIHNILGTSARQRDYMEQDHRLKEIIVVPWQGTFLNKTNEGFCLGVFHTQKNYTGDCRFTYWI